MLKNKNVVSQFDMPDILPTTTMATRGGAACLHPTGSDGVRFVPPILFGWEYNRGGFLLVVS
jgi:hypothetical protein